MSSALFQASSNRNLMAQKILALVFCFGIGIVLEGRATTKIVDCEQAPVIAQLPSTARRGNHLELRSNSKYRTCWLQDEHHQPISPMAVLLVQNDLYFLGPDCIWEAPGAKNILAQNVIETKELKPPPRLFQEFNNFVYLPARESLVILEKSGDLIEFNIRAKKWQEFRPNFPITGQPDPDFVDFCVFGDQLCVLDPERNQAWFIASHSGRIKPAFKEILPWQIKSSDQNFSQALSICSDGKEIYVSNKEGIVTKFGARYPFPSSYEVLHYKRPNRVRPSRLITSFEAPLYVVERENNRVLAIDKKQLIACQFLFPDNSDLRGLLPEPNGFWIIDGNHLIQRKLTSADQFNVHPEPHPIDSRLDGMTLPIAGVRLPRHPGVYPGARRLYRYGVHAGMDLFNDPGCRAKVVMGTPVRAADSGEIIRADVNFTDMGSFQFSKIMSQCLREHRTSEQNEDLFRGCQVWINHGKGLVTRYAHLSKINRSVKEGLYVSGADVIGYVGVSGTGQHLAGRTKFPHLHFEIWLDGKYLGWGLNPAETIGVYEDVFGQGLK
jgi:hypothetical protein